MVYIGKTDNMIKNRHSSHKHLFQTKSRNIPLFEHHRELHPERLVDVKKAFLDYQIEVLHKNRGPTENAISEAI